MMTGVRSVHAHAPQDLEAVDPRQHQIEHHQIGAALREARDGGLPVLGDGDLEALELEVALQDLTDHRFIVHNQHTRQPHPPILPYRRHVTWTTTE